MVTRQSSRADSACAPAGEGRLSPPETSWGGSRDPAPLASLDDPTRAADGDNASPSNPREASILPICIAWCPPVSESKSTLASLLRSAVAAPAGIVVPSCSPEAGAPTSSTPPAPASTTNPWHPSGLVLHQSAMHLAMDSARFRWLSLLLRLAAHRAALSATDCKSSFLVSPE